MNYKKKEVSGAILIVFLFFTIDYYLLNNIGGLKYGFNDFIDNAVTVELSYYSAQAFYFIVIPSFLIFLSCISKLNQQYVVRSKTKLHILRDRLIFLLLMALLFMYINLLVGVAFPIVNFELPLIFIITYSLQSFLFSIVLLILGLIYYLINIFIKYSMVSIAAIYLLLILCMLFNNKISEVILNCNVLNQYYSQSETANLFTLFILLISTMLVLLITHIATIKHEEYYNVK